MPLKPTVPARLSASAPGWVAALGLAASTMGCSTILNGTSQQISINSNIQGAQVYIDGQPLGATPLVTKIPRSKDKILEVTAPGYQPQVISMTSSVATAFWINILTGGLPGSTTDLASGAIWEYSPSAYYAQLSPGVSRDGGDRETIAAAEFVGFALHTYAAIARELAVGEGPHLETGCRLLEVPGEDCTPATDLLRGAMDEASDAVDFALKVSGSRWPSSVATL